MNYHSQKREIKRIKKATKRALKSKRHRTDTTDINPSDTASTSSRIDETHVESESDQTNDDAHNEEQLEEAAAPASQNLETRCWAKTTSHEEKSREEEFDDYLADLLL